MHRKSNTSTYSNEYFGLLIEGSETITLLTSHLIIGYEPLGLASACLCRGQCYIKTRLKFVKNPQDKLNDKSFLVFLKSLSFISCFYGSLPGEKTEIYLLTYYLIYFYVSLLIISEDRQLIKLMQVFGLHPIIYWTSRFCFDLILSTIYSFILYFIYSLNDQDNFKENDLTLQRISERNNLRIKNKFYPLTFIISTTTLPFIYLITS